MATFDLNDYETVEERLRRFWALPESSDARIVTLNHTTIEDRKTGTWVVEARIYLSAGDQANDLPKATGWAFEIDGAGMANKTSALENCETSAIGRALANMNLSGNKRASRTEMEKVARGQTNYLAELASADSVDSVRALYQKAVREKAPKDIVEAIKAKGESLK